MSRFRMILGILMLLGAVAAIAQNEPSAPPKGFDPEACARHCREMAAAHQKRMDEHKAMMDKNAAAWKEIRASVDAAKKARGEKKVAALETALERLVAFHESMMAQMPGGPMGPGMMAGRGMMGQGMMGDCGDCCAGHHGMHGEMHPDCPMMQKKD